MSQIDDLGPNDLRFLEELGISERDARRQLQQLRQPSTPFRLVRPCRVGDGIERLRPQERARLSEAFRGAAAAGRFTKFVPASGAASRMFKSLLALLTEEPFPEPSKLEKRARSGESSARDYLRLITNLPRFPFAAELERAFLGSSRTLDDLRTGSALKVLLETLLTSQGLALAELPKGLLPFHRYSQATRTPFEEHLVEGARYLADRERICRFHLTVPPPHQQRFEALAATAAATLERARGVQCEIGFSIQSPATDTLAVDLAGRPVRREDGTLLLRPGGHGALLSNLSSLGGDLVFLKNIDNVLPDRHHQLVAEWKTVLGGKLVELQDEVFDLLQCLHRSPAPAEALRRGQDLIEKRFGGSGVTEEKIDSEPEAVRQLLIRGLDRPLRVCGVVPRSGDPGGAPFWVRNASGQESLQIVETAEVPRETAQQQIFAASTHFNPVDVVCGLRDWRGEPFDLAQFVDPEAVFISRKSHAGAELRALERPGLWNGAMARWNTVFVEVPGETFAPVKTIFDLLLPEHQPTATDG